MKNLKVFSLATAMLISYLTFSQERTIIGTVSDKNEKLPFVTVNIKGTQKAVQTDFDGKFSIKAKKGDKLIFSFLGFDNYEQEIGEKVSEYQIILKSNAVLLEETYGYEPKVKKKNLPSTTVISEEELKKPVEEKRKIKLVNKINRKIINPQTDEIIASNSFNNPSTLQNEPILVINGVITSNKILNNLNPNNIESVNILKDKSAIAVFGKSGENGVILITTKNLSKKQLKKK